ncbi:MAG: nuclear transport factor 2 family protein [Candidatus Hermodarchaeota archaeon]
MDRSEEENIRKTLNKFVEGLRTLDYDKISETFYAEGQSIGVRNEQISYVLRDHWKEMRDQAKAEGKKYIDDAARYEIKSLEIIGNAVSVIVELFFMNNNEVTERYTDFFHMLKTGGKWIIVNKIYPTRQS